MSKKHHPNKSQPKKSSSSKKPLPPPSSSSVIPLPPIDPQTLKHQQRILTLFADAFSPVLSSDSFTAALQSIKQALFNRDFDAAFGTEEKLQTYAARWSPTRALCYSSIFQTIAPYIDEISPPSSSPDSQDEATQSHSRNAIKMLCIGGCAAEHIAFASHLRQTSSSGTLTLLDVAPWTQVVDLLQKHVTSPPPLSKYASAALKAANTPFLEEGQLSISFAQNDILAMEEEALKGLLGTEPLTVTLLFTLNELYTSGGIGKTSKFLKLLGETLPERSLLLVVDSPGSYSEAAVGKEEKRYPMQWLLDHTLLEVPASARDDKWEKLESHDSIWFRLPEELFYTIQLENMRYQMHLYQKKSPRPAKG
jgi:25S rRNA (uracil2843-N3)-methyltransferase